MRYVVGLLFSINSIAAVASDFDRTAFLGGDPTAAFILRDGNGLSFKPLERAQSACVRDCHTASQIAKKYRLDPYSSVEQCSAGCRRLGTTSFPGGSFKTDYSGGVIKITMTVNTCGGSKLAGSLRKVAMLRAQSGDRLSSTYCRKKGDAYVCTAMCWPRQLAGSPGPNFWQALKTVLHTKHVLSDPF